LEKAQEIIARLQNSTPPLEEIGLLTVRKVTPKDVTKNVRVTQVHGSMEGKDVLKLAMKIRLDKEIKEQSQKDSALKRNDIKNAFFRCKMNCVCDSTVCDAIKLKECPICHNVLKSKCRKISCQNENGEKPVMILPAAAKAGPSIQRKLQMSEESDDSDIELEKLSESESDDSENDKDDTEESENEKDESENIVISEAISTMIQTQKIINPPTKEKDLIGKWFAVVFNNKRKRSLFIAKLQKRFLLDKDGPADEFLMRCLKPKTDSGIILEDTPKHLPPDEGMFSVSQIIAGPLKVIPKGPTSFMIPEYENILAKYRLLDKEKEKYLKYV